MIGDSDGDASRIKEVGWRQGSVLSPAHITTLQNEGLLSVDHDPETTLAIVLSHDCDVTNSSFLAEPYAELLIATLLPDSGKGNFYDGKNPRVYHLFLEATPQTYYECSVHNRCSIDRRFLLQYPPDTERVVRKDLLTRLRKWVSRRYIRDAFPDNFNFRATAAQKFVEKKQKEEGQLLVGIYILLTDKELNDDQVYEIAITGTMLNEDYADLAKRTRAVVYLINLADAFNQHPGIGVDESENNLIPEDELTVGEIRELKRWDTDSLSLRIDPPSETPPYE